MQEFVYKKYLEMTDQSELFYDWIETYKEDIDGHYVTCEGSMCYCSDKIDNKEREI